MQFQTIKAKVVEHLRSVGNERMARLIQHAVDPNELHSCLREYVFMTDAKVYAFFAEIKKEGSPVETRQASLAQR
jgi:hypothetical protein